MANDEEIHVEYDTTGVPSNLGNSENSYSAKISSYFYNKLNSIDVNNDFTQDEINEYGLNVSNGKINISTTVKLINYLKSYVKSTKNTLNNLIFELSEEVNSELDKKLNITDYKVDSQLNTNSENPLTNKIISQNINRLDSLVNGKSNLGHTHEIKDINYLPITIGDIYDELDKKSSNDDLQGHINNKNNPHNVTLAQLGIEDTGWDNWPITQKSFPSTNGGIYCRKYGKMVIITWSGEVPKNVKANTTILCTLKPIYRPNHTVYGVVYRIEKGTSFTYAINTDGTLIFGADVSKGTRVRIYDCFFTK